MKAVIASILLLLVSASVVHAECAWVVWGVPFSTADVPSAMSAHLTKPECDAEAKLFQRGAAGTQVLFKCFPDTIDPRGPKGTK